MGGMPGSCRGVGRGGQAMRVNGEVAGGLDRVTDMEGLGAGEGGAVGFAGAHGFAEMVGPGFDGPDFDPAFGVCDVFVEVPVDGAGAAAPSHRLLWLQQGLVSVLVFVEAAALYERPRHVHAHAHATSKRE